MRLAAEIIQQILMEAVEILPFAHLFQTRLVNHHFAEEILHLILKSPRFHKTFRKDYNTWRKFPFRIKRPYLLRLTRRWLSSRQSHGRCLFAHWAHEMLTCSTATKLIAAGHETRESLVEKLADAGACGNLRVSMFQPEHYEWVLQAPHESVSMFEPEHYKWTMQAPCRLSHQEMDAILRSAMACSAIQRGDCAALQRALGEDGDQDDAKEGGEGGGGGGGGGKLRICFVGGPFAIDLLDVTARMGNREIVSFIAKRGCSEHGKSCLARNSHHWNQSLDLISVAARRGNRAFLEVWLDQGQAPRDYGTSETWRSPVVRAAYLRAVMIGRLQILELLESKCDMDLKKLRFDGLVAAIKTGQVDAMKWFLDRGVLSINMQERQMSWPSTKPLLLMVLQDCNHKSRRLEMMQLLLDTGQVNANERHPISGESILWCAMKQKNPDIAMLLLDHGAVVDKEILHFKKTCSTAACNCMGRSVPHYHCWNWRVSLLQLSLELDSPVLLRRLLAKGMRRSYYFKNMIYRLKQGADQIKNIERWFMDMGLDETVVKEEPFEYFILDTASSC